METQPQTTTPKQQNIQAIHRFKGTIVFTDTNRTSEPFVMMMPKDARIVEVQAAIVKDSPAVEVFALVNIITAEDTTEPRQFVAVRTGEPFREFHKYHATICAPGRPALHIVELYGNPIAD
jgi:hypothetical protein